jgi:hypothetical protein
MGNGYTFELESLIFYAISIATALDHGYTMTEAKRCIGTYGDDLICPQEIVEDLIGNLGACGFQVNTDKSYTSGYFFESCGRDYYNGSDVRPFFLKREIKTVKDVFFVCNSLLYWTIKTGNNFLLPAYKVLLNILPDISKLYGPLHFDFEVNGQNLIVDDLESALRVPLWYAQANGGVKFDFSTYAWRYRSFTQVALKVPGIFSNSYSNNLKRYLLFLKGHRDGIAYLKGSTSLKIVSRTTSRWDGDLTNRQRATVDSFFESLV